MDTSFSEPTFRPPPSPRPQLLTPSRPPTAFTPLCLILSANALMSQALSTSHLNHHNLGTGLWPPASPSSNIFICPASQPASHLSIYPSSIHPSIIHPPPYPSSCLPPFLPSSTCSVIHQCPGHFPHATLCAGYMSRALSKVHIHSCHGLQQLLTAHELPLRCLCSAPRETARTAFCPASHLHPVTRVPL